VAGDLARSQHAQTQDEFSGTASKGIYSGCFLSMRAAATATNSAATEPNLPGHLLRPCAARLQRARHRRGHGGFGDVVRKPLKEICDCR